MPNHWTYQAFQPGDDLAQGDIIARTPAVLEVLKNIHAYFCDPKYLCFIILTQSCDLVMRGKACKARQIGLGVVRALDEVLPDTLAELCGTRAAGVYRQDARIAAEQFLERVINQNEQAHGLFYLHPDADVEIAVPAVAMLRVSIALRSREHYNALKEARRGRLGAEFRNKLGWLTGNLFSRVDTPDWGDGESGEGEAEKLVANLLDRAGASEQNVWVPDSWLQAAAVTKLDITAIPRREVRAALEAVAPPPAMSTAIERVRMQAARMMKELNDSQLHRLVDLVRADEVCPVLAAQAAFSVVRGVFGSTGSGAISILDELPAAQLQESLTAQVSQAVAQLRGMKGPREIAPFLDILRETPIFDEPTIACICGITERGVGAQFQERRAALVARLQAEKMTRPLVAQLHGLARNAVEEVLVEKLSNRLENDGQFRGSFKRG